MHIYSRGRIQPVRRINPSNAAYFLIRKRMESKQPAVLFLDRNYTIDTKNIQSKGDIMRD